MKKSCENNIYKLRTDAGLTQQKLADAVHVSRDCIVQWENGKRPPAIDKAIVLADYFGVSVDYIIGRSSCRSVDNEYIHNVLGLSDKAISNLKAYKAHDEMFNYANSLKGNGWNFLKMDLRLPFINTLLTSNKLGKLINAMFLCSCPDKFSKLAIKFNDYQMTEIPQNSLVLTAENDLTDNIPVSTDSELNKAIFKTKLDILIKDITDEYKNALKKL